MRQSRGTHQWLASRPSRAACSSGVGGHEGRSAGSPASPHPASPPAAACRWSGRSDTASCNSPFPRTCHQYIVTATLVADRVNAGLWCQSSDHERVEGPCDHAVCRSCASVQAPRYASRAGQVCETVWRERRSVRTSRLRDPSVRGSRWGSAISRPPGMHRTCWGLPRRLAPRVRALAAVSRRGGGGRRTCSAAALPHPGPWTGGAILWGRGGRPRRGAQYQIDALKAVLGDVLLHIVQPCTRPPPPKPRARPRLSGSQANARMQWGSATQRTLQPGVRRLGFRAQAARAARMAGAGGGERRGGGGAGGHPGQ